MADKRVTRGSGSSAIRTRKCQPRCEATGHVPNSRGHRVGGATSDEAVGKHSVRGGGRGRATSHLTEPDVHAQDPASPPPPAGTATRTAAPPVTTRKPGSSGGGPGCCPHPQVTTQQGQRATQHGGRQCGQTTPSTVSRDGSRDPLHLLLTSRADGGLPGRGSQGAPSGKCAHPRVRPCVGHT